MTATVGRDPVHVVAEARKSPERRLLPSSWALAVLTVGYPIWWMLGIAAAAWPLVSLLLLARLSRQRNLRAPRGFGIWLLFVVWVILSASQIDEASRVFSFGYRFSVYFSATVMFLYVYNQTERQLPRERAAAMLTGLWAAIAIGGAIGAVVPRISFPSVAEIVLPDRVFSNSLVYALSHPQLAQVSRLFGQEIGRPHALFPYTNGWGSAFGILLPVVIAWMFTRSASRRGKLALIVLLFISVFSVIASLNRGLWLSVALVLVYTGIRFAQQRQIRALVLALLPIAVVAVTLAVTPLGQLATDRAENGHSDEGRSSLYTQSIDIGLERPILGWGTPQPRADKSDGPSVGTHGQIWLVLVSQGVVGVVLYMGWWFRVIFKTWRQPTPTGVWMHAALVVVVMQSFFYEHTPIQLPLAMVVAALLLRPSDPAAPEPPSVTPQGVGTRSVTRA